MLLGDLAAFSNYVSNKSDLNNPEEGGGGGDRSWCRGRDRERQQVVWGVGQQAIAV